MIYCVPKRCGSLLLTALLALALPHAAQADDTCHLAKEGDCCAVTISPKTAAQVETGIVSTQLVEFVVIRNTKPSVCSFIFDGEMKVPMRVRQSGFAGTWIGGKTTLRYESDEAKQGSCKLALFYMNIASAGVKPFPEACEKPKT